MVTLGSALALHFCWPGNAAGRAAPAWKMQEPAPGLALGQGHGGLRGLGLPSACCGLLGASCPSPSCLGISKEQAALRHHQQVPGAMGFLPQLDI